MDYRLLIVADDPEICELTAELFTGMNDEITITQDGAAGLERFLIIANSARRGRCPGPIE